MKRSLFCERAQWDLNPRPPDSRSDTLSAVPCALWGQERESNPRPWSHSPRCCHYTTLAICDRRYSKPRPGIRSPPFYPSILRAQNESGLISAATSYVYRGQAAAFYADKRARTLRFTLFLWGSSGVPVRTPGSFWAGRNRSSHRSRIPVRFPTLAQPPSVDSVGQSMFSRSCHEVYGRRSIKMFL